MNDPHNAMPTTTDEDLPTGDHPLEIAARRGIGPLSPLGEKEWHGHARPCVSCGLLVLRDQRECDHCGQDLSDEMIERMKAHAGPWYVLEHLRPFPGVSLERILRQIKRGVLTETSIIRGPSTDFQWRFAVETPGICRHFGKCWKCQGNVGPTDAYCKSCLSHLAFERPSPTDGSTDENSGSSALTADLDIAPPIPVAPVSPPPAAPPASHVAAEPIAATPPPVRSVPGSSNIEALKTAVRSSDQRRQKEWDEPPRVGGIRATWIAVILLVLVVAALVWLTNQRSGDTAKPAMIHTPVTQVAQISN